jgi:hypothetical protein
MLQLLLCFISEKIVDLSALDVLKGEAPVFEANPGLGFISRGLLAAGVQRLFLWEPSLSLAQHLKVNMELTVWIRLGTVLQLAKFPAHQGS